MSCVHEIAEHEFFNAVADGIHLAGPFHLVVALEFFGYAFNLGVLPDHQVVRLLRIPIHTCQILFEGSFHSHNVNHRGAVLFQIIVVALSPNADAGNKFIFHIANTSFATSLYRKRFGNTNVREKFLNRKIPGLHLL